MFIMILINIISSITNENNKNGYLFYDTEMIGGIVI